MKIKKAILTLSGGFDSLYIQKTACASGKEEAVIFSCGRRDSNPHASRHQILSLARLPITPRPHFSSCKYTIIFNSAYLIVNRVKIDLHLPENPSLTVSTKIIPKIYVLRITA